MERRASYETFGTHLHKPVEKVASEEEVLVIQNKHPPRARSHSASYLETNPTIFLVDPDHTLQQILVREDTDSNQQVTVDDKGPKFLTLPLASSSGYTKRSIRGNYQVSSLLQELALLDIQANNRRGGRQVGLNRVTAPTTLHSDGHPRDDLEIVQSGADGLFKSTNSRPLVTIHSSQIQQNPVDRLNRMILHFFWPALIRRIDAEGITMICMDSKNKGATHTRPRVYVPCDDEVVEGYFNQVALTRPYLDLEVVRLPPLCQINADFVYSLNDRPGILALGLERVQMPDGNISLEGKPFVVPGGRFNEMYGWDSYFSALGLLEAYEHNDEFLYICKSMVDNFVYEIEHYGKILNANRSYYLLRTQPPFLTDMIWQVYRRLLVLRCAAASGHSEVDLSNIIGEEEPFEWIQRSIRAAIQEYRNVWMAEPRYISSVGLSRYCGAGRGIPPETEASHFDSVIKPFADKAGISIKDYMHQYNEGIIKEPHLDEYFMHDGAVRESGHDTTYRLDGRAANLCTVDLCCLLYKYECDIAQFIGDYCGGSLMMPDGTVETVEGWLAAAAHRRTLADKYLWNEEKSMYFDYDWKQGKQITYESATCFWALWSKMASQEQANAMVTNNLKKFEAPGGLVSGTEESLGKIGLDKPNRQWDYPFGWAPHQVLAWEGLQLYGFERDARRLAYRWLYMITRSFADFNGVVPEKFDAVKMSHKVNVEYGNVGTDFKLVPREGFGWMNASYTVGQKFLGTYEMRALKTLAPPETVFRLG